jgi:hypothetical protein
LPLEVGGVPTGKFLRLGGDLGPDRRGVPDGRHADGERKPLGPDDVVGRRGADLGKGVKLLWEDELHDFGESSKRRIDRLSFETALEARGRLAASPAVLGGRAGTPAIGGLRLEAPRDELLGAGHVFDRRS